MLEDAASKGMDPKALARKCEGISLRTIYRFLSNQVQTTHTANELARVIGRPVGRYVIRSREALAS